MKKVIERMNSSVEEQQAAALRKGTPIGSGPASPKEKQQKKWLFRRTSGNGKDDKNTPSNSAGGGEEEVEGMRVDFYLVVFLKFIASIVPTIEVDSTASF